MDKTEFKLFPPKNDIFSSAPNISTTAETGYPLFSLGFHHFIHKTKDKMEITEKFKDRKKVYLVVNEFERYVDNYDNSVDEVAKKYFKLDNKPKILSRAFFKLWEILSMFDVVPLNKSDFISAHLAEGPGSFIQATMFFRDKYIKKGNTTKNDKYYAVTLHSEDDKKHVPELEKTFVKHYEKEKPVRFIQHVTYPKKVSKNMIGGDNGDLTDPKTVRLFGGNFVAKQADLVTADGGFNWEDENTQEQEAMRLIFGQITTAVKIQAKGGSFVCKIFESFTATTIKCMYILSSFYNEVYITKPLMSRPSNSEKYIVCKGFVPDKKKADILEKMLSDIHKSKHKYLDNIFTEFNIPEDYEKYIEKINTQISNTQIISINKIIDFIKQENYRGTVYDENREKQISASKMWVDKFFP